MRKTCAGFTLIELMVVVSIISMLASIMLVSLNSARVSARNGRVVEETTQLRNEIEQSWNGKSYTAFVKAPAAGASIVNIVAPNSFSDAKINILITDILAQNGGAYGGGAYGVDSGCGTTNPVYLASYNSGYDTNGLSILVYPSCGPVTSYAVYASKAPILLSYAGGSLVDYAYAAMAAFNPSDYAGYFCVDSTGNAIIKNDGWIPGYTGTYPSTVTNTVTDGRCH